MTHYVYIMDASYFVVFGCTATPAADFTGLASSIPAQVSLALAQITVMGAHTAHSAFSCMPNPLEPLQGISFPVIDAAFQVVNFNLLLYSRPPNRVAVNPS